MMTWKKCEDCKTDFEFDKGFQINCYLTQFETRCPVCDKRERNP